MVYSVFILFGADKDKANEFMGDTDILTHAVAGAQAAISDAVGFEVGDTYANKLTDEKSVALSGNVTEMTFSTAILTKTKYQNSGTGYFYATESEDVGSKKLKHTLTVKGNLEYPNILFALGKELAKKKDTSRIWQWANTPLGVAKDAEIKQYYYRDVVATVFANDDRQFRAIHLKDAFVGSYEEYYDKNGDGHFTLVINKMIDMHPNAGENEFDIEAKGPEMSTTFSSFTGDIAKAAKTAGNLVEDAADVTGKIVGEDNEAVKKMRKTAEGLNKGGDDMQKYLSDGSGWNPDDIAKDVDDHVKYVKETKELHDGEEGDSTTKKTEVEKLPDGGTKTTVTVINDDGSKDITITTKDKDGNETVEKKHEDPPGYKDMDW